MHQAGLSYDALQGDNIGPNSGPLPVFQTLFLVAFLKLMTVFREHFLPAKRGEAEL
jgi:hypothetical protein